MLARQPPPPQVLGSDCPPHTFATSAVSNVCRRRYHRLSDGSRGRSRRRLIRCLRTLGLPEAGGQRTFVAFCQQHGRRPARGRAGRAGSWREAPSSKPMLLAQSEKTSLTCPPRACPAHSAKWARQREFCRRARDVGRIQGDSFVVCPSGHIFDFPRAGRT